MTELMHEIENYWENRAPGYSKVNQEELKALRELEGQ